MNLLSFLAFTMMASGSIISPIQDVAVVVTTPAPKATTSFAQIKTAIPTPTPTKRVPLSGATPIITHKQSYTIALLGDSMIDTLGPGIPALQTDLKNIYPLTNFSLLNYGVGGTNIEYAIERIINKYDYLGNHIASLVSAHPDIVVIESCAYNPLPSGGINQHWLDLAKAVDTIKTNIPGAKIIIAATIAPNSTVFGDGAPGISFSREDKVARTAVIKQYLESTIKFAAGQHLPLADAYHPSLTSGGEGNLSYINNGDHIHYSDAGRALFAKTVAAAIQSVL